MKNVSVELTNSRYGVALRGLVPSVILADGQALDAPYALACQIVQPEEGCLVARATVANAGSRPLRIRGIRWSYDPTAGGTQGVLFPAELGPRYFCTENFRGDWFGAGTTEGDRFGYELSNQQIEMGWSEDGVFPGLFIAATDEPVGLLIAQATQAKLWAIFRWRGKILEQSRWLLEIEECPGAVPWIEIPVGGTFAGEKLFFAMVATNDPQRATGAYFRQLRRDGLFARRALNPLPAQRIYCSWNYDFMADIDEEKFLGQIPILKKHFPSVKFLQLDDGYQTCHAPGQRAMIDLCYGDLPQPFDAQRFPSGPKALADRIRAAGLRPAIWLGLWASLGSRMLQDHDDWILRDDAGRALRFGKWYGGTAILDPSVPGVRDYLERLAATVFGEWGFEGVKLDFSSFAFNAKRVRFRHGGRTQIELRHELEAIFRRHLPADGFFGWCVVAGTAQPFLSQADYFRNAIDIGHGNWNTARRIALWTANTYLLLQEPPCLPNIDSIGWSRHFDETAWETWLSFCAVSSAALELSGDLRKLSVARLRRLARTLEFSDPARTVRCPGVRTATGGQPPAVWLAEGADATLVGAFNWTEQPLRVELVQALTELPTKQVTDAWTGEPDRLPAIVDLPPRGSRLWLVRR